MSLSAWYRLSLTILLSASLFWFWMLRFDELAYHLWGPEQVVDLGDAVSLSQNLERAKPLLNSYVNLTGVLGNKAATLKGLRAGSLRYGDFQLRHLLGSKIYVEYDQEKYKKSYRPFAQVEVKGRLVSFGPDSELIKVRQFFKDYYRTNIDDNALLIVVDEKPNSEAKYAFFAGFSLLIVALSFYFSWRGFCQERLD